MLRTRARALLASTFAVALSVLAPRARAQSETPAQPATPPAPDTTPVAADAGDARRQVGVLLLGVGGVDADTAEALTEVLIAAVAERGGVQIMDSEVFQARLGQDERQALDCVSSPPCVGRVAIELGLVEVVTGTVGPRGDGWAFSLDRVDARTGEEIGRAFEEVHGDQTALITALRRAVPRLYQPVQRAGSIVVRSTPAGEVWLDGASLGRSPARRRDVSPGRHRVIVRAQGCREWSRTVSLDSGATLQLDASPVALPAPPSHTGRTVVRVLTWTGVGIAVAAGAAGTVLGLLSQSSADTGTTRADVLSAVDSRRSEATLANVSFVVAGAGAVTAAVLMVADPRDVFGGGERRAARARTRTTGAITPIPGGVAAGVGGTF